VPLPTFLIIGAPKCGSSALYAHLAGDPRVVLSRSKEPAYFTAEYGRGQAWYEAQFPGEGEAVGEATVGYLSDPLAAERIHDLLPDARLVVLVRNPFDRARSHYWWRHNNGVEARSLDEVLTEGARAFPIRDGLYSANLQPFLRLFAPEQILVLRDVDLRPGTGSLARLWTHLGLTEPVLPADVAVANTATERRGAGSALAMRGLHKLRGLRSIAPSSVRRLGARAVEGADRATRRPFVAPPLTPDQVSVMAEHFLPDLGDLEDLLGAGLEAWRAPSADDTAASDAAP
jgi:hypothetical protein